MSSAPDHQARQTEEAIAPAIVNIRTCREKRERDVTKYAFIGAVAIQNELQKRGDAPPSVRTVQHILVRHGFICPAPASASVREVLDRHDPALTMTRPGQ